MIACHRRPTLAFGRLKKLTFSYKLKYSTPRISWLGTFGLLVIFLTPQPHVPFPCFQIIFSFIHYLHKSHNIVHLGGLFALKQWISCSLKHDTVPRVSNLHRFYVKNPPRQIALWYCASCESRFFFCFFFLAICIYLLPFHYFSFVFVVAVAVLAVAVVFVNVDVVDVE